jgi:hypothetical protein
VGGGGVPGSWAGGRWRLAGRVGRPGCLTGGVGDEPGAWGGRRSRAAVGRWRAGRVAEKEVKGEKERRREKRAGRAV